MEKLTLEHLAAYLPYGLKILFNNSVSTVDSVDIKLAIEGNRGISTWRKHGRYTREINLALSEIKPVLHPLSKLTEEIEHNGERIIVADIIFPKNEYKNEYDRSIDIGALQLQNAIGHSCTYYSVVQTLFRYHFDVFGLIEKGLAIEKQ